MAHIIKVSRNNSWIMYAVLILAIFAIVILPTRSVDEERVNITQELRERVELRAIEQEQNSSQTIYEEKLVEKNGPLPYEAAGSDMESQARDNTKYAQQTWKISFEEELDECLDYTYRFYRRDSLVNIEDDTVCFNNQKTQVIKLEEAFTGELDSFKFNLTVDAPLGTYYVTENVSTVIDVPNTAIVYENVTITEPVNVTTKYNVTKKVNWLFGFSWE